MFGRKNKKQEQKEQATRVRKGLLFWLPGGSSRLDVYYDYCVMRCLTKTKMAEKERVIPFTSIKDVIYTPPRNMTNGSLQLITKEMPDVKRSYWYAYENNLIVLHPSTEELGKQIRQYILNPNSVAIPPEYLNEIKKEARNARREEAEAQQKASEATTEKAKDASPSQDAAPAADDAADSPS